MHEDIILYIAVMKCHSVWPEFVPFPITCDALKYSDSACQNDDAYMFITTVQHETVHVSQSTTLLIRFSRTSM